MAICGASAALAISAVLPKGENHERDTVFTVIGVTALSTIAMIVYPLIIALFHLDHAAIGVFLGGTIHNIAQVVGAGFSISEETGTVATFTKLLRVAMLLPVVMILSFVFHAHNSAKAGRLLPGFLVVFAVLVAINSLGIIPTPVLAALKGISHYHVLVDSDLGSRNEGTSLKAMAEVARPAPDRPDRCRNRLSRRQLVLLMVLWKF